LSKRRAQKIIDFFTQNGLRRDRIVIDFKGELHPVESNTTDDGKRLNRRVDFSFI
jgi:outer membrane protein OmpA-like peptidoglycan-associated protein